MCAQPSIPSVLITGGNGMLARALRELLDARGNSYVSVDLPDHDITDEGTVAELFRKHHPSLLFNCAAYTKVDLCEEEIEKAHFVNAVAVGILATHAARYNTKLVHLSTDFVFDGKSTRPYLPGDPPNPLSVYGRSKLLGEEAIVGIDPPGWLIVRTSWLYGPGGASFPKTVVERAKSHQPLKVVDDQVGCPTYTYDLAQALLNLVDCKAAGIFHVTNSLPTTWYEFAKAILEEFSLRTELTACTTEEYLQLRPQQAIRPMYSVLDTSAYTKLTGQTMRPWREALRDYRGRAD